MVKKYEIPVVKITSGQRMALVGLKGSDVAPAWKDLGMDVGGHGTVCTLCAGMSGNRSVPVRGPGFTGPGHGTGEALHRYGVPCKGKIRGLRMSHVLRGELCAGCGSPGEKKGWTVIFGGNSGARVRIGDVLAEDLDKEAAVDLIRRCLYYYAANGKKRERTARFMERIGIDALKEAVL